MIGNTVSHYEVLEELGGGGMGVVYRARDMRLGRQVALKFLPPEWSRDSDARQRFAREARAASTIEHPNICTVYDVGETDDGQLFIAMAFCAGQSLRQQLQRGPLPVDRAVTIAVEVAEGLRRAHEAGVIHRDIKPANILLDGEGHAKIVDFGLAKLAGEAALTREGALVGTPNYMSPEQASSEQVDQRTDLWSLGVVLYEMLSGRRPFTGDNSHAVLFAVVHADPEPIDRVRPGLPKELCRIVGGCLEKDPEKRYESARDVLRDLRRFRGDSWPTEELTKPGPVFRRPRDRRRLVAGLAAAAATAALLLAIFLGSDAERTSAPTVPEHKTLVVLPFVSADGSPMAAALCDGLLDELTETLAGMQRFQSSLTVIPASEVRAERISDAARAHTVLGANLAVKGRVQSSGNELLRFVIQLVETTHAQVLSTRDVPWAGNEGKTLQQTLVHALTQMLELDLDARQQAELGTGGTGNREANRLYVEAIGLLDGPHTISAITNAVDLLRSALDYDTGFTLARVSLADACLTLHRLDGEERWLNAAMSYARQAVQEGSRRASAHVVLGQALVQAKQIPQGMGEFRHALELDPLNSRALQARAEVLIEMGDDEAAETSFREACSLRPNDWLSYNLAGRFYFDRRSRFDTAAEFFRRAVERCPDCSVGWANLGASLFMLGEFDAAREALEQAVQIGPTASAYANLGTLEFYNENFQKAATLYHRALELDDKNYTVWNNLAECLRWGKAPAEEIHAAYRRVSSLVESELQRRPDDAQLHIDLASAEAFLGNQQRSQEAIKRAIDCGIETVDEMVALAAVYELLGKRTMALEWIDRSLRAGYPREIINEYEGFAALREDPRFEELAANLASSE